MSASSLPLPTDVAEIIDEFACKRRSNGKESNDLVLHVRTSRTASQCEKEVRDWVFKCFSKPQFDDVKNLWNIVIGEKHEDFEEENEEGELTGVVLNELVFAIHLPCCNTFHDAQMDKDELIIVDEYPPVATLRSDDVLASLDEEPPCVVGIGVSAVGEEYMMRLWEEIIGPGRNTMDGSGKGYMQHPMWRRWVNEYEDFWSSVRERSFNFGWTNYNPTED